MAIQLTKQSIDLGIVIRDPERSLAFYRDTLGMEPLPEWPLPGNGGTMYPLQCGGTVVKLVHSTSAATDDSEPERRGLFGVPGYRYCTIWVANLAEITQACADAGYRVVVPITEVGPGNSISIVEDPDGNLVEFANQA